MMKNRIKIAIAGVAVGALAVTAMVLNKRPEVLCYKLFTEHGFTWGGDWVHSKDYQHFEKSE